MKDIHLSYGKTLGNQAQVDHRREERLKTARWAEWTRLAAHVFRRRVFGPWTVLFGLRHRPDRTSATTFARQQRQEQHAGCFLHGLSFDAARGAVHIYPVNNEHAASLWRVNDHG